MAEMLKEQQAARDEIAKQAAALDQMAQQTPAPPETPSGDTAPSGDQPSGKGGDAAPPSGEGGQHQPSPEQVSAARALQQATQQFAQAQRATGQGAAEISGQQEVVNQPIREGLEAASQLDVGMPANEPPPPSGEGTPPAGNEPPSGQTPAEPGIPTGEGQPAGQSPESGQGQPPSGHSPSPTELGTGLVPSSPEVTAQQIAGAEAMQHAAEALAQALPASPTLAQPGQGPPEAAVQGHEPGQMPGEKPEPGDASSLANVGGARKSGESSENQKPNDSPLQLQAPPKADSRTANKDHEADVKTRKLKEDPWFAKLPPELRQAIQARARQRAPRGYEERLRRYFESIQ
jgi:hypothetical protein